ncbi:11192_t:CDS:2, partial [Dentiscutata erythropus]
MWDSNILNDISIEIDSDETIENFSESNKSIPAHFKTHSEAIYTSKKFDYLSCKNAINSDQSYLDNQVMQENDESLLIINPLISQNVVNEGKKE